MPYRDWRLCIQDILQSIATIQHRTAGMTFEEFQRDETIIKAVLYDLIIIGEASSNVPDLPWRLMGDARNVIAHEYFQVNLEIIWDIITNDFPPLIPKLQDLLQRY